MMRPTPYRCASASALLLAALGIWGWFLDPGRPIRWTFVIIYLPALWGYVELMQGGSLPRERAGVMNWHRWVFAAAGLIVAIGLAPQLAVQSGVLDAWWLPVVTRVRWIVLGLAMALWGNYLPKLLSPWHAADQPFDWPRVHRFAGWLFTLGGIGVAAAWLLLPPHDAATLSGGVMSTVFVLAVGRKLVSLAARHRNDPPDSADRYGLESPPR